MIKRLILLCILLIGYAFMFFNAASSCSKEINLIKCLSLRHPQCLIEGAGTPDIEQICEAKTKVKCLKEYRSNL